MLDLSSVEALVPLARLVREFGKASGTSDFVIVGASARDIHFQHYAGIDTGRGTKDTDLAFSVSTWSEFEAIREALLSSGEFSSQPGVLHRLLFRSSHEVDIIPFGGVEKPDRTIEWPPGDESIMSTRGIREAFEAAIPLRLPEKVETRVVSVAGLALLKFGAWKDRRHTQPGKDAHDLKLILTHYLDVGDADRLYVEFPHLVQRGTFDYTVAGAHVLGTDLARLLHNEDRGRFVALLEEESDPNGRLRLIGDLRMDPDLAVRLISAVREGALA